MKEYSEKNQEKKNEVKKSYQYKEESTARKKREGRGICEYRI